MDQEHEQNPEASQPVGDANQPVVSSEPVESTEPATTQTPQVEEVPVNPFASPVVEASAPAPSPVPAESAPVNPFATEPQAEAVPPVFATTSAPTPPEKKSHKGLIIGLVVGFVVLLAAVGVAGYWWYTNIYVSKADYQQASTAWTQLHDTNTSLSTMGSAVSSSSSSVNPSDITAKVDELDAKTKDLGNLKAVQKDSDLKKAYDALLPNLQEQIAASRAAADFLKASDDCGKMTDKTQVASCVDELRAVKDESTGGKVKALATAMADYIEGAVAGKNVSYSAEANDFTTYSNDLQKKVTDTANAFSSVLSKKV